MSTLTLWVECSHVARLVGIEGSHLYLMLEDSVRVPLKEHLIDGHVKGWDHLQKEHKFNTLRLDKAKVNTLCLNKTEVNTLRLNKAQLNLMKYVDSSSTWDNQIV